MFSDTLAGLSIKLGGRLSHEKATSENPSVVLRHSAANPTVAGALPTRAYSAAGTRRSRTFKDFTPEAGIEWKPSRDLLLYYTCSEGFKAGSGENASGSTIIVDPETIRNHEIGVKATLLDRRVSVNFAGYSHTLDGLQLNKTISGGPTGYTTIFQNAATPRPRASSSRRSCGRWTISGFPARYAYTDAHFSDYLMLDPRNPANVAGGAAYNAVTNPDPIAYSALGSGNIQLAGNDVRNSPRWSWNLHGEVDAPLSGGNSGQFTLSGDVSHKSRTYFSEFERDIESSRWFTMVDASLGYVDASKAIRLQLWVKNLFDIDRPASTFALATGRLLGVTYLPPRTYGVSAGYRF